MAIDTQDERASAIRMCLPLADTSVNQGDRQQVTWNYRGIVAVRPEPPTIPGLEFTLPENRMHFTLPDNLPHFTLPENRMHFTIPEED